MNINQELSKGDIDENIKKIFPDKKAFLEGQLDMMKELYTEEDKSLEDIKWADVKKEAAENKGKK